MGERGSEGMCILGTAHSVICLECKTVPEEKLAVRKHGEIGQVK